MEQTVRDAYKVLNAYRLPAIGEDCDYCAYYLQRMAETGSDEDDEYYEEAKQIIKDMAYPSANSLARELRIGCTRASRF